jgi:hypothetical protein
VVSRKQADENIHVDRGHNLHAGVQ